MDPAISLVQAYLRLNGYLTVTDYPLFEQRKDGEVRAVTDLDVVGFRLGRPGTVRTPFGLDGAHRIDPALVEDPTRDDMIIAEVKGGTPRFNDATLESSVLGAALVFFGGCSSEEARDLAQALLSHGEATASDGHTVRIIAFGSGLPSIRDRGVYRSVSLLHVSEFMEDYLRAEWPALRQVDVQEPALDMLQLLMKARTSE